MAKILEYVTAKLLGISTIIFLGNPAQHIMFCQENIPSPAATMLTRGFASIHLVKYSTDTTA
jgi:hypothetical protein